MAHNSSWHKVALLTLAAALAVLALNACKSNSADYTPPPATPVNATMSTVTATLPTDQAAQTPGATNVPAPQPTALSEGYPGVPEPQTPGGTNVSTPQPTAGPEGYPAVAAPPATLVPQSYPTP